MNFNPMLLTDFYKISHRVMMAKGTEQIYSTITPRSSRIEGVDSVVFFGLQGYIKEYLIDYFNDYFFNRPKVDVIAEYSRVITHTVGAHNADTEHIEALHDLGYLPLEIKAVPEGTNVPIRVPMVTITNTHKDFAWLTNFLETLTSAEIWKVITSTTIAREYRGIVEKWADITSDTDAHLGWQCHNFSYRGMSGNADGIKTGAGHLLYFDGTDTIPSICYHEKYYNADIEQELVGSSVLATEHSIQCQFQNDEEYYNRLLDSTREDEILSIVSDGYDYWNVIENILPKLKDKIMDRSGKIVVRPDSGDPVDIICGIVDVINFDSYTSPPTLQNAPLWVKDDVSEYLSETTPHGEMGEMDVTRYFKLDDKIYEVNFEVFWNRHDKQYYYEDGITVTSCDEVELTAEQKGSIQALYDTFGGTLNSKGYKVLDPHIGLIYGDAITLERADTILAKLKAKGFSSENVVFGVGSYSLGYHTRDTFGMAVKATYTVIDGEEIMIFKDPKTDDGTKKSQRGMVAVTKDADGTISYIDGLNKRQLENTPNNILTTVFRNGILLVDEKLSTIRQRVRG